MVEPPKSLLAHFVCLLWGLHQPDCHNGPDAGTAGGRHLVISSASVAIAVDFHVRDVQGAPRGGDHHPPRNHM